jgi:hypothetical protein
MASANKRGYLCSHITRPHLRFRRHLETSSYFYILFFFSSYDVSDMHRDTESWRGNSAEVEIVVVFFSFFLLPPSPSRVSYLVLLWKNN